MTWFKVDDSMPSHPKTRSIPRRSRMAAIGVWTACGTWSSHHLTDGRVSADVVEDEGGDPEDGQRLVASGLWHEPGHDCDRCPQPEEGEYQFHDWPHYQPTREQVLAERAASAERQRLAREKRRAEREAKSQQESQRDSQRDNHSDTQRDSRSDAARSSSAPTRPDPTRPEVLSEPLGKRAAARPIPDDWTPNDGHRAKAAELRLDADREATRFRDHAKANDRRLRDWHAGFRTWLDKARDFRPAGQPPLETGVSPNDPIWGDTLGRPS